MVVVITHNGCGLWRCRLWLPDGEAVEAGGFTSRAAAWEWADSRMRASEREMARQSEADVVLNSAP